MSYDPNGQFELLADGATTTDSFTYTISDGNGGTDTALATVTLNGVNDVPTALDQSFVLDENSANGTVVGTLAASDPDAGTTFTYAATGGTGNGAFAIDAATGEIT
ncbi:MAG: Ig-like domain-containing protein, partial [Cyanobacteria bacterium J06648_11]